MSSFRQLSDGRRQGKSAEKPNFAHTCNLLTRYIKEKGSLRTLNIEIGGKIESLEAIVKHGLSHSASACPTMEFVTNKAKLVEPLKEQQPDMAPDSPINGLLEDKPTTSKDAILTSPKTSQLTIFYSGMMLIFDDYPADKVKDIVAFAKREERSQMSHGILSNTSRGEHQHGFSSHTEAGSDLPIARRSSINRFLEKRRERAAVSGPYQVQELPTSSSSKGDEQLELKL